MAYIRKTKDNYILMGLYCGKWEELASYDNMAEARADKKAYRENERGSYKIIKKREKIGA